MCFEVAYLLIINLLPSSPYFGNQILGLQFFRQNVWMQAFKAFDLADSDESVALEKQCCLNCKRDFSQCQLFLFYLKGMPGSSGKKGDSGDSGPTVSLHFCDVDLRHFFVNRSSFATLLRQVGF